MLGRVLQTCRSCKTYVVQSSPRFGGGCCGSEALIAHQTCHAEWVCPPNVYSDGSITPFPLGADASPTGGDRDRSQATWALLFRGGGGSQAAGGS